jgi:hypothetical protein
MMPAKCGAFHHKEKQCLIYRSQASERKSFHLPRLSGSRCRLPMPRAIYQVNLDQPMLKHDVALKCQIAQFISLPICHMSHTKKKLTAMYCCHFDPYNGTTVYPWPCFQWDCHAKAQGR